MSLLKSTGQCDEALVDLPEASLQVLSAEVLRVGQRLEVRLRQLHLMLQRQQITFVLVDQLAEVKLRHRVLELQAVGRLVRPLRHVRVLDYFGCVAAQKLDGELVVVHIVRHFLQATRQPLNLLGHRLELSIGGADDVRRQRLLLLHVRLEVLDRLDDFLRHLRLLHLRRLVLVALDGFRLGGVHVDSAEADGL